MGKGHVCQNLQHGVLLLYIILLRALRYAIADMWFNTEHSEITYLLAIEYHCVQACLE